MLSQFRGDKKAWPVYLSLGNIAKDVCRKPTKRAMVLLGYIPTDGLDDTDSVTDSSAAGWQLYHDCMERVLHSLIKAGTDGVEMLCADGRTRLVFPIVVAYMADFPEQSLVSCVLSNHCPKCLCGKDERQDNINYPRRDAARTLKILQRKKVSLVCNAFVREGLRPVYRPFGEKLPHFDVHASFTPGVLHELHKGMFSDHMRKWIFQVVDGPTVDERFKCILSFPGQRIFKKGISGLKQGNGTEFKQMQRVYIGVLYG